MRREYHSFVVFYTHPKNNFTGISFIAAPDYAQACLSILQTYPGAEIWRVEETDMTFPQFQQVMQNMHQDLAQT
jgi:hypothetical protein